MTKFVSLCGIPDYDIVLGQCNACGDHECNVPKNKLIPAKVFYFARRKRLLKIDMSTRMRVLNEDDLIEYLLKYPKFLKKRYLLKWMYVKLRRALLFKCPSCSYWYMPRQQAQCYACRSGSRYVPATMEQKALFAGTTKDKSHHGGYLQCKVSTSTTGSPKRR